MASQSHRIGEADSSSSRHLSQVGPSTGNNNFGRILRSTAKIYSNKADEIKCFNSIQSVQMCPYLRANNMTSLLFFVTKD
jgi:hypothetical protein